MTYHIWSIEHDAWWRPGRMGYAPTLLEAGIYSEQESAEIVARANIVAFHECRIPTTAIFSQDTAWQEAGVPRPAFTCPTCGAISYNPHDIEHRYCGRCHQFHEA